jgi:hypothetical protein
LTDHYLNSDVPRWNAEVIEGKPKAEAVKSDHLKCKEQVGWVVRQRSNKALRLTEVKKLIREQAALPMVGAANKVNSSIVLAYLSLLRSLAI